MTKPTRILVSCGEASGDLYASELLEELRKRDSSLEAFGLLGERGERAGGEAIVRLDEVSVIGLVEVVRKLPSVHHAMTRLSKAARERRPDAAVLIDFSGFNLRLARRLKAMGIPIVYYVSPQVWAWRRGRVRTIREVVDQMLVILPFEEAFYAKQGVPVHYVGHPLVDLVRPSLDRRRFCGDIGLDPERAIVTILPGSRRRELELHLPILRGAIEKLAQRRPGLQILVSRAPTVPSEMIVDLLGDSLERVRVLESRLHEGLTHSAAAIVASGTATVEAALCGTPLVMVYRVGALSYFLGRRFVDVPFYSMVNLIAERKIVPELVQDEMTASNIVKEISHLLDDADEVKRMKAGLLDVKTRLGGGGASSRAAEKVLSILREREGSPLESRL